MQHFTVETTVELDVFTVVYCGDTLLSSTKSTPVLLHQFSAEPLDTGNGKSKIAIIRQIAVLLSIVLFFFLLYSTLLYSTLLYPIIPYSTLLYSTLL